MLGALIGDMCGSIYEFANIKSKDFKLVGDNSFLTDDSIMTLAVCECLQKGYINNSDLIIDNLKRWGNAYPNRGYGGYFSYWLTSDIRTPYNSFGNGAAMRISAVGWYAKTEEEVKDYSKKITEVTHNHPLGLEGAEVVAMCIYYAKMGKDKAFIKAYAENHYNLNFNYPDLVKNYEFNETCQDTVPEAIYCFLISKDFEDCIRTSISIGGDSDTLACISCSIAEAYYKELPEGIVTEVVKRLPRPHNGCNPGEVLINYIKDGASNKFFK